MSRRRDKSLIKLYKDLMITRRDLIDLRESINHTINSIKDSDHRLRHIEAQRNRRESLQAGAQIPKRDAAPSFLLKIRAKCNHCNLAFPSNDALSDHIK